MLVKLPNPQKTFGSHGKVIPLCILAVARMQHTPHISLRKNFIGRTGLWDMLESTSTYTILLIIQSALAQKRSQLKNIPDRLTSAVKAGCTKRLSSRTGNPKPWKKAKRQFGNPKCRKSARGLRTFLCLRRSKPHSICKTCAQSAPLFSQVLSGSTTKP